MKYSQRLHRALIIAAFAALFAVIGSAYCQSGTIEYDQAKYAAMDSSDYIIFKELPKSIDSIGTFSIGADTSRSVTFLSDYRVKVITLNIYGEVIIFNTVIYVDTLAAKEVFGKYELRPVEKKGRCPECNRLRWKSRVWEDVSLVSVPAVYIPPSWDEDGNSIVNLTGYVRRFHCARGHEWTE